MAMPAGQVSDNTLKVQSPVGEVVLHQKAVNLPANSGSFIVLYADAPVGQTVKNAETELDSFRTSFISTLQGSRATNEKKISLAGRPGTEFEIMVQGKGNLKVRVYLDKSRFYCLIAGGPSGGKVSEQDSKTFFDSFQITAS